MPGVLGTPSSDVYPTGGFLRYFFVQTAVHLYWTVRTRLTDLRTTHDKCTKRKLCHTHHEGIGYQKIRPNLLDSRVFLDNNVTGITFFVCEVSHGVSGMVDHQLLLAQRTLACQGQCVEKAEKERRGHPGPIGLVFALMKTMKFFCRKSPMRSFKAMAHPM